MFVSSPQDVVEERNLVEKVVESLNPILESQNVRFKLIRWEVDVRPGVGNKETQDVIDSQIPQDFDIFIGIMWLTVGGNSTTNSGTIKEYKATKKRLDEAGTVEIMFYFKDQPPKSLEDIDPKSLNEVNEFKAKFGERGLYRTFRNGEKFEQLLRTDLINYIKDSTKRKSSEHDPEHKTEQDDSNRSHEEDELGLFDLSEAVRLNCEKLCHKISNITEISETLVENFRQRTDELNSVMQDEKQFSPTLAKSIANAIAADMNRFCAQMEEEILLYKKYFNSVLVVIRDTIEIIIFMEDDQSELDEDLISINHLIVCLDSMDKGFSDFVSEINDLPILTKEFYRAKRRITTIIQEFIDFSQFSQSGLGQIASSIEEYLLNE